MHDHICAQIESNPYPLSTPEDLMTYVENRVARYKRVRYIEIIDQIPKSPSGKILRRVLVARAPA